MQKQLDLLTRGQTRLENALAQVDAQAYQQSAKGPAIPAMPSPADQVNPAVNPTPMNTDEVTKLKRSRLANRKTRHRRVMQQD